MTGRRISPQERGFTLIEAAVAALVLAIFLGGALGMVVRNNQIARQTQARLNATQEIRSGIDRLNPLLRRADRLLFSPTDIPASDRAAVGSGFFPSRTTGANSLLLQIPVFDKATGALTGQNSYAMLYVDAASATLKATYALFRADGSVDYKRRDEILVDDLVLPKTKTGATLPCFTYFNLAGDEVTLPTASSVGSVIRVKIALASRDDGIQQAPTSQIVSEIRLANQSVRTSIDFVVYNPYSNEKTLTSLTITGPDTATLTKVDFGETTVWSGTQSLGSTPVQLPVNPAQTLDSKNVSNSTLWFDSTGDFTGNYTVTYKTTEGEDLATSFTH